MDKLLEKLKQLNTITPREDWVQRNRQVLLSQIATSAPEKKSSVLGYWYFVKLFIPVRVLNFVVRPVGVAVLALLIILGSGGLAVNAAKESLPGEFLYSVKLTSEKVRIGLTISDDKKARVHTDVAKTRVREIEAIADSEIEPLKKREKITVAADGLKREVGSVHEQLNKVKETADKDKAKVLNTVRTVDTALDEISQRLNTQKDKLIPETEDDIRKQLQEAVKVTDRAGVKAVEVIVNRYDQGESEVRSVDVTEAVSNKLRKVEDKLKEITESNAVIRTAPAITDEATDTETSTTTETVTPETNLVETATISDILKQAQELLNQGDLLKALEKIKESEEAMSGSGVSADNVVIEPVDDGTVEE